MAKLFIPLIKRKVSPQFCTFFGKLNFWQKFDRCRPHKIVEIFYYLKLWKENIFWLNYLFPSSKERFVQKIRQFLENWIFCQNSTGADLTKIVKILYYLKLWKENIFWLNYLIHSSKERFLQKIMQFFENWIFCQNSTGATLTKIVKFLYYLKKIVVRIYFLAKLFISLIKRKVSPQF